MKLNIFDWSFSFEKRHGDDNNVDGIAPYLGPNLGLGLGYLRGESPSSLSAVYAAAEMISNSIAELPFNVKTTEDGKNDLVQDHSLYYIFDKSLISRFVMFKNMIRDCLLEGNGYAYIRRAADGSAVELIYCQPVDVTIRYNDKKRELYYLCPKVTPSKIEPVNMLHIVKNAKDGVQGKGILHFAYDAIKLAKTTNKAAQEFFGSGCNLSGILSTNAPKLSREARQQIKEAWNETIGYDGRGFAILEGGMSYSPVSVSSKDSQLLESRVYNLEEIARYFNISPVLLGDLSKSSYNTIEAAQMEYVTHTLYPLITMFEQECTRKLLRPSERSRGLYIDLDDSFLLKSTRVDQSNYLKNLTGAGIISTNEARKMLGLNAVEGGDNLIIPYTNINNNTINNSNGGNEQGDQEQPDGGPSVKS